MIPNRVIFIWLGKSFPWSGAKAICSAWKNQKPESIWLIHEGLEKKGNSWEAIKNIPTLQLMEVSDKNFEALHDDELCLSLFRTLKSPASKAHLLRLALLYKEGGVSLDTDVMEVRPWNDLLHQLAFCGVEPVAFPNAICKSLNPFRSIQCRLLFAFHKGSKTKVDDIGLCLI